MKEKLSELFYNFKKYHIFSKILGLIIFALFINMPSDSISIRQTLFAIIILFVIISLNLTIINHMDKKKSEKQKNREAFASYILATYHSLDCYNPGFEKEGLPGYLYILRNWENDVQQFRDPDDDKNFKILVEFSERNELPLKSDYNSINQLNYQRCAYLFLLYAFIGEYWSCDYNAPINQHSEDLYFKLISLCHLTKFKESAETLCSKKTRDGIKNEILEIIKYYT